MLRQTKDDGVKAELETVRSSIEAYLEGFEVGTGNPRGNVLPEPREATIARNIQYVLRSANRGVVLAFYGAVHVQKKALDFPAPTGEKSNYRPLALRLAEARISVVSVLLVALSGSFSWRGNSFTVPSQVSNYRFSEQESVQSLLDKEPKAAFFWVDLAKQPGLYYTFTKVKMADVCDFLVLITAATPMKSPCVYERQKEGRSDRGAGRVP